MQEAKKTDISEKNRSRFFVAPALGLVVILIMLFFQNQPFSTVEAGSTSVPHWGLLLNPFNENFVHDVWFGVNLPEAKVTGERFQAFGIGALTVAALFFVGRFLFVPFSWTLPVKRGETWFFSGVLGLIFLSFGLLVAGLAHHANLSLLPYVIVALVAGIAQTIRRVVKSVQSSRTQESTTFKTSRITWLQLLLLFLFASFFVFASTQPLFEYDVLEYHAQGAREIFENGSIPFSTNNAYLNMPLGVEMFYVAGLNLARDFGYQGIDVLRIGLLVGKTILTSVALLVAFGILCFCNRFFGSVRCGCWCALVFLSFPNLFEVFSNGLNDAVLGLAGFTVFYTLLLSFAETKAPTLRTRLYNSILTGIVAGFAASVKYTGVVFICIPSFIALGVLLLKPSLVKPFESRDSKANERMNAYRGENVLTALLVLIVFVLAGTAVAGGWYAKNYAASGNPVFPLGYKVFGDSTHTWNDSVDARWKKAHSSSDFGSKAIVESTARIFCREDFDSPFYIFVPLIGILSLMGVFVCRKDTELKTLSLKITLLFGIVVVFWIMWFFLTHRLTRFLLPLAPFSALMIGTGIDVSLKSNSRILKYGVLGTALFSFLYSGLLIDVIGQGRLAPLRALEQDPDRFSAVALYFNEHPELLKSDPATSNDDQKILLVGEAKACAYHARVLYSTCWNDSPLISMIEPGIERDSDGRVVRISDANAISNALHEAGVAFIVVDFGELARFRSEGNYGFNNPEIDQNLFMLLLTANILELHNPKGLEENAPSSQIFRVVRQ